jgi:DNA-binding transcriptional MerR regulator
MRDSDHLRTVDLARLGGISVQQVRNHEATGLLPPVTRSASGYRLYTQQHLEALLTTRNLVHGYGWPKTTAIMQAVHHEQPAVALALIDERHAELAARRRQLDELLPALQNLTKSATQRTPPTQAEPLRVGEAARRAGVRVSAVHFWEQQGLLTPLREPHNHYRLYDAQQVQRLRVIALLRQSGYRFDAMRPLLDELAAGYSEQTLAALAEQRERLIRASWQCLEADECFLHYLKAWYPQAF